VNNHPVTSTLVATISSNRRDHDRGEAVEAGVAPEQVYEDTASGKRDDRPGLAACLKALREGDTLIVDSGEHLSGRPRDIAFDTKKKK